MAQDWNDFIEQLYCNEYERLFSVAFRTTKSWNAAQDLVQEAFWSAAASLSTT